MKTKTLEEKQAAMAKARESKTGINHNKPENPLFMTIPEICEKYRINRTTLRDLLAITEPRPKSVKSGKQERFKAKDIQAMMSEYE